MHILFLSDNFPPEVNAPASRTFDHCAEWVRAGHKVTVITCVPNFPAGRVFPGYRNRLWQEEMVAGIRVIRVWTYIARNEGFARRILDFLSYMISGTLAAMFVRGVDIVVGTSPQFFTACAAYAVAAVKRRPWVFELRDLWPESIRAVGAVEHDRLLTILENVELFLYRRADAIVAVTQSFRRNLIDRGIEAKKIFVITNGVDASRFQPSAKHPDLLQRLDFEGKFVAGYVGTHGMAHGLDTLLAAAARLQAVNDGRQIAFLMLGDGAERERLQAKARAMDLSNVLFLDPVRKEEVAHYWSILDVAIIHLRKSELFKTVIPSKLFECMAMGIPVLHGVEGESAEIVIRHEVGMAFEPENADELVECLLRLRSETHLHQKYAARGPSAAAYFDRKHLAGQMLAVLKDHSLRQTA